MIVEMELIEQIADEPQGWELSRVVEFLDELGRSDHRHLLGGMWRAGAIHFTKADEGACAEHEVAHWLRGADTPRWCVHATDDGVAWAFGRRP